MTQFDNSNFKKMDSYFKNSILQDLSKFQDTQFRWTKQLQEIDKLRLINSPALEASKAFEEINRVHLRQIDSMKAMLDPISNIRNRILSDTTYQNLFKEFQRPSSLIAQLEKAALQTPMYEEASRVMRDSLQSSLLHAQQLLSGTAHTSSLELAMKQFRNAHQDWSLPTGLIDSIGSLKALQGKFGNINLPVLDLESATTLANLLGPEGIASQLSALGIAPDGSLQVDVTVPKEKGIGLSRKTLDLISLLSFILSVLMFIYQELSSQSWQNQTTSQLQIQQLQIEQQAKLLKSLSKLVEKSIIEDERLREQRFVVRDRIAVVRSSPKHGASIVAKLLPCEVVTPISENGKWIEVEYYNWLQQRYETGWSLKKYFKRVPGSYNGSREAKNSSR